MLEESEKKNKKHLMAQTVDSSYIDECNLQETKTNEALILRVRRRRLIT